MQYSCYIEINLICMILLFIMYLRLRQNRSTASMSQKIMRWLIAATAMLCISDIFAIVFRGRMLPGVWWILQISNTLYLLMIPVIAMLWYAYTRVKIKQPLTKHWFFVLTLPLLGFTLIALSNPWTGYLFRISPENLYSRGPGVYLHWIVCWSYFLCSGLQAFRAAANTESWVLRNAYRPLLTFLILPAIGCITQMIFYGITSVQAGITLSLVMVSIQMQDNQISADELTGLNNRAAMQRYLDALVHRTPAPELVVFMVDVNKFKHINDTLGHTVGDAALRDVAVILRNVCRKSTRPLFLCRYGGDEFVYIGQGLDAAALMELIHAETDAFSQQQNRPYVLSVSIGYAAGSCGSFEDFDALLRRADRAMYLEKKAGQ